MSLRLQRRRVSLALVAGVVVLPISFAHSQSNTRSFRNAIPAVQKLVASGNNASEDLRLALASAAADRAPEFDVLRQARESGLLTDWKVVGPLGRYPNSDFDHAFAPESDGMRKRLYANRRVTSYLFPDGKVDLPISERAVGIYYAAADLYIENDGEWRVWVDTLGTLEVFVDGQSVLRKDTRSADNPQTQWTMSRIDSGRHRVLVKFLPGALPFRVAVMAPAGGVKRKNSQPQIYVGPESQYTPVTLRH